MQLQKGRYILHRFIKINGIRANLSKLRKISFNDITLLLFLRLLKLYPQKMLCVRLPGVQPEGICIYFVWLWQLAFFKTYVIDSRTLYKVASSFPNIQC